MDIKPIKKSFEEIASAVAKHKTEKKRKPRAKKKKK